MIFLAVEDDLETTSATVDALRDIGHTVREVGSVEEAREVLSTERIDLVLLDQQVPEYPGGAGASDQSVEDLARSISSGAFAANAGLNFVWLTAHEVEHHRKLIDGCLGTVSKSGNATKELKDLFARAIDGFYEDAPPSGPRTRVLVEFSLGEFGEINANVPAWRPEILFVPIPDHVPAWVRVGLRATKGRPLYVTANANLHAQRVAHLDLADFDTPKVVGVDESELWDA
jgi:CheY-like chemotaxis protein